ncbi:hypothetical protein [Peptococcus simiae]|uniref:hypothetical protein n=1 Tax=Peptococcus simiae TaxID=1643805 RepID=UPI003980F937
MTDKIFFDTDCISAFLWVNNECLLEKMYSGKIIFPGEVYRELSSPRVPHLKERADYLLDKEVAEICRIDIGSQEFQLFQELTSSPSDGYKIIGRGEAAAIALTKFQGGVLASNNLRDIQHYIKKYSLNHIATGDILVKALEQGLIDLEQGEQIWKEMLAKRRKIGADSFRSFILEKGFPDRK